MASTVRTISVGTSTLASPESRGLMSMMPTNSRPRLGMARKAPVMLTARKRPRPVWPTTSPSGTAISAASPSAMPE